MSKVNIEGYNCPKYKAEMPSEIEEMAKIIHDVAEAHHIIWCTELAKVLYKAGYRKQSENLIAVVRCCDCKYCEVVIDSIIDEPKYFCTRMVGSIPIDPTDYCSRAKMKGGE